MNTELIKELKLILEKHPNFDTLITLLAIGFININESKIDEMIIDALKIIGEYCEIDRSYIYKIENIQDFILTYEWHKEGIKASKQEFLGKDYEYIKSIIEKFNNKELINFSNSEEIIKIFGSSTKEPIESQEIKSILFIPILMEDNLWGLLGFTSTKKERIWDNEDLSIMKIASEIFSNAIFKKTEAIRIKEIIKCKEEKLKKNADFMKAILNTIPDEMVIIEKDKTISWSNNKNYELKQICSAFHNKKNLEDCIIKPKFLDKCPVDEVFKSKETIEFEIYDGENYWWHIVTPCNTNGKVHSVLEIRRNITERKKLMELDEIKNIVGKMISTRKEISDEINKSIIINNI